MKTVFNSQEMDVKHLIGKRVIIVSDNEQYSKYLEEELTITHASIGGLGYDWSVYETDPENADALCCFVYSKGRTVPFSLYEWEFEII